MAQAVVIGPPLMEGVGFQHVLGRCTAMARDMAQTLVVEKGAIFGQISASTCWGFFPTKEDMAQTSNHKHILGIDVTFIMVGRIGNDEISKACPKLRTTWWLVTFFRIEGPWKNCRIIQVIELEYGSMTLTFSCQKDIFRRELFWSLETGYLAKPSIKPKLKSGDMTSNGRESLWDPGGFWDHPAMTPRVDLDIKPHAAIENISPSPDVAEAEAWLQRWSAVP